LTLVEDASTSGDDQSTAEESSPSGDTSEPPPTDDSSQSDASTSDDTSEQESGEQTPEATVPEANAPEGGAVESGGPPGNLVTNGDFSQGMTDWNVQGGSNKTGYPSAATPYLCVTLSNGANYVVGWSPLPPFPLPAGTSYTFSYKAWTTGIAVSVEAKVALSYSPYTADLDVSNPQDSVSTSQTFTHPFTTTAEDPSVGIAFLFDGTSANSGIDVCFDDVTLVPQ
jgi:hypothetical protein